MWTVGGANGTTASGTKRIALAGVANTAATVGTGTARVTPVIPGMFVEKLVSAGILPLLVMMFSLRRGTQVTKVATTEEVIGRAVKVLNSTARCYH